VKLEVLERSPFNNSFPIKDFDIYKNYPGGVPCLSSKNFEALHAYFNAITLE